MQTDTLSRRLARYGQVLDRGTAPAPPASHAAPPRPSPLSRARLATATVAVVVAVSATAAFLAGDGNDTAVSVGVGSSTSSTRAVSAVSTTSAALRPAASSSSTSTSPSASAAQTTNVTVTTTSTGPATTETTEPVVSPQLASTEPPAPTMPRRAPTAPGAAEQTTTSVAPITTTATSTVEEPPVVDTTASTSTTVPVDAGRRLTVVDRPPDDYFAHRVTLPEGMPTRAEKGGIELVIGSPGSTELLLQQTLPSGCGHPMAYGFVERSDRVEVAVYNRHVGPEFACTALVYRYHVVVTLSSPLGDRPVYELREHA